MVQPYGDGIRSQAVSEKFRNCVVCSRRVQRETRRGNALPVKQSQSDLATKQDITLLKFDINQLRPEKKSGKDQLRTELKFDQLRSDLKADMNRLSSDIAWIRRVACANLAPTFVNFVAIIIGTITLMRHHEAGTRRNPCLY